jgi:hypothetical protein
MPTDILAECDYCGTTINTEVTERCTKCTKYINEDPEEFGKWYEGQKEEAEVY